MYRTAYRTTALFRQTTLALMQQPEIQHENIQCYQYNAETERVGKGKREVGGGGLLTYLRFSRKGCRHDRLVRNAQHACINTSPLLLSYLLTSILRHHFQPYSLQSYLFILFHFILFVCFYCNSTQSKPELVIQYNFKSMYKWINHYGGQWEV